MNTEINAYRKAMSAELNDLRREREILAEEVLSGRNKFAEDIKDVLGEQIAKELAKKPKEEKPVIKKPSKIKVFFEKLTSIL